MSSSYCLIISPVAIHCMISLTVIPRSINRHLLTSNLSSSVFPLPARAKSTSGDKLKNIPKDCNSTGVTVTDLIKNRDSDPAKQSPVRSHAKCPLAPAHWGLMSTFRATKQFRIPPPLGVEHIVTKALWSSFFPELFPPAPAGPWTARPPAFAAPGR